MTRSINLFASADNWLWREGEDGVRIFLRGVTVPSEEYVSRWHECTQSQKEEYEEEMRKKEEELLNAEGEEVHSV